jgi:hypothetical protein
VEASAVDQVAVFKEVFRTVRFPYFAADLERLALAIDQTVGDVPTSHYVVQLSVDPERLLAGQGAVVGFLGQVQVPDGVFTLFARSEFLQRTDRVGRLIQLALNTGAFSIVPDGETLTWNEQSLWPVAYSTFVSQWLRIVRVHELLIRERVTRTGGFLHTISEFPRHMPTHVHYAAASLGAWLGGAINVQYFGFYATIPQVVNPALNVRYAESIGYTPDEARQLDASGLIALPGAMVARLLRAQGSDQVFGSIGFDEMNTANPPDARYALEARQAETGGGFVTDKYFRAPFRARHLVPYGLFGARNVFRDHYKAFYDEVHPAALVRCKHFCAPVIEVSSLQDIRDHVSRIPIHHKDGVFFRGQVRFHPLRRDPGVRALLFSDSCSVEPSLTTSASRDPGYDYDTVHFALKYFIEQIVLNRRRAGIDDASRWTEMCGDPSCPLDYALMALSQHYGLPSHGLDITTSDEVALWFAVHQYRKDATGTASYHRLSPADWPDAPDAWPVIFACQTVTQSIQSSLHDCHELTDFGYEARRPIAQRARFFLGGHSDHQNRLAEAVVCVFRLRPGDYATPCSFETLFPAPGADPAYQLMLDFARSPDFGFIWGKYVNRFHGSSAAPTAAPTAPR